MDKPQYPVRFSIDYPDRTLNRVTTFFRIIVALPILVLLGAVSAGTWEWTSDSGTMTGAAGAGGLLFSSRAIIPERCSVSWKASFAGTIVSSLTR